MTNTMVPNLLGIFQLLVQVRPHVEAGRRNAASTSKWKEVYDRFFGRVDGLGRNFLLWNSNAGFEKFKTSLLAAIKGHTALFLVSRDDFQQQTPIQVWANDLQSEMDNTNDAHETLRAQ